MPELSRSETEAVHRFGDVLVDRFSPKAPPSMTRKLGTVTSVSSDDARLSVLCDGDNVPMVGIPCTTACAGVGVDDRVIVELFRNAPIVTNIIAKSLDNSAYVKTLWSNPNGVYMHASQTAELSEPVSAQRTGIVLHWQGYVPGDGIRDYQHNFVFVPKTFNLGTGLAMVLSADDRLVTKYVYVKDVELVGNDKNMESGHELSGLTVDNRRLALTEVLGV